MLRLRFFPAIVLVGSMAFTSLASAQDEGQEINDITQAFDRALQLDDSPTPATSPELPTPAPQMPAPPFNIESDAEAMDVVPMPDRNSAADGIELESIEALPEPGQTDSDFVPQWPVDDVPSGPVTPAASCPTDCQSNCAIGPRSPRNIRGFHCVGDACGGPAPCGNVWDQAGTIPWQAFAQGDYVGPARRAHVPEYRLRVDDVVEFVFRITGATTSDHYRLQVGDTLRVESLGAPEQNRENVAVQPDGYITLGIAGEVLAAGRTLAEVSQEIEDKFEGEIKNPRVTVAPTRVNTVMEEFRNTVDNRAGIGGQSRTARVTPAGSVQLPAIGSISAQGLTLNELKREIEAAYGQILTGLEVTPILQQRADRFVFVVGEVQTPGRFTLEGPTTLMQAVALAGGWNNGANLNQVIVFRRDNNWDLMAARFDLCEAMAGNDPCPAGEVWLRDSDIVLIPKTPLRRLDDALELVFTRGVYAVFPVVFTDNLTSL